MEKKERIAIFTCIAVMVASFLTSFMPTQFVFYYSDNWLRALVMLMLPDAQPASWLTAVAGGFRWIGPFFGIWGAFGLYAYFSSERRNVSMLRFMLGFLSVKLIFTVFFLLLTVIYNLVARDGFWSMLGLDAGVDNDQLATIRFRALLGFLFWMLSCAGWAFLYVYAYKILDAKTALRTGTWEQNGKMVESFVLTDKAERFFHVLLDTIILFWFVFTLLPGFMPFIFRESAFENYQWLTSPEGIAVFIVLLQLLYYPLTETLFRRSLTKTLTSSVVTSADGSRPGLGAILVRTLCRLIPLNPFSFFGESGWHDRFSKTYVLKDHIPEPTEELLNFQFSETEGEKA